MGKVKYDFTARVWQHSAGWYFVSLPKKFSEEIRENFKSLEEGWGRLKAVAKLGSTEWKTAIWFDAKQGTYLLPIKSEIRKKEKIEAEEEIDLSVLI